MRRHIKASAAFSILELLVVVSIMTIVILIAVPSFRTLTYSMRRSSAENSLKGGLRAARMVAIEAGDGIDAAAVFIHEPGGRITILPCVYVGDLLDRRVGSVTQLTRAQVFAPVAGVDAVQLPKGWSVRAYAPPNSITSSSKSRGGWYDSGNYPVGRGNWIFPETGFYDADRGSEGDKRQTFMVRYRGGSGEVDLSTVEPVLVLSAVPSTSFRIGGGIFEDHRADTAVDQVRFVRSVLDDDVSFNGSRGLNDRVRLLGNIASDTVLARAVGQLAVYSEARLAGGVGARRLNRKTETLYEDSIEPKLDLSLFGSGASEETISDKVSDWLESRLASSDAMIFTVQRYSGRAQEMIPLEPKREGTP